LFVKLQFGECKMLRAIISYFGKLKNPKFKLSQNVSTIILFSFLWDKMWGQIRGLRLVLHVRNPKLLMLGKQVTFRGIKFLKLGQFIQIGNYVSIIPYGKEGLSIGNYDWVGSHSSIKASFNEFGDYIVIGNNVDIGEYAHLGGAGGLTIGDDCTIGPYFSCPPENHNFYLEDTLIRLQGVNSKGLKIGKNCWIGAKVTILDGVSIGDNCIIAAGAVVAKSMPSNAVLGGVPARVIKFRSAYTINNNLKESA
jgi:acetyltransferase-like isoleucine patch superfamily enzyme